MKDVTLPLNAKQIRMLTILLDTGLWGNSVDEVAMRCLDQQIAHEMAERGVIPRQGASHE